MGQFLSLVLTDMHASDRCARADANHQATKSTSGRDDHLYTGYCIVRNFGHRAHSSLCPCKNQPDVMTNLCQIVRKLMLTHGDSDMLAQLWLPTAQKP